MRSKAKAAAPGAFAGQRQKVSRWGLRDYADIYRKLAKGSPTLSKPESLGHPPF
jgi:hypothetical protein